MRNLPSELRELHLDRLPIGTDALIKVLRQVHIYIYIHIHSNTFYTCMYSYIQYTLVCNVQYLSTIYLSLSLPISLYIYYVHTKQFSSHPKPRKGTLIEHFARGFLSS